MSTPSSTCTTPTTPSTDLEGQWLQEPHQRLPRPEPPWRATQQRQAPGAAEEEKLDNYK